jgi:dihydrofolate reductase
MIISIIAAIAENGVIGKNNSLIWHLPNDLNYFKKTTQGHCIITGRKNYDSIPQKYRPLPNRTNIIVTRTPDYKAPGAIVVHSIEDALNKAKQLNETECFIIGGGELYLQTLPLADKLYITHVHHSFEGDTFFKPDFSRYKLIKSEEYKADEKHAYPYTFCVYEKC